MEFTTDLQKLVKIDETPWDHAAHDFGVADNRGRTMGCKTAACRQEWRDPLPGEDWTHLAYHTAGTTYVGRVHVTRNGKLFGGSYSVGKFETAEERDRWVEKKVTAARKQAAKKGAKP